MKTLFIVGLPIGNRKDITERAKEVLESVDYIFAEDTREIAKLELNLKKTLILNNWNEKKQTKKILEILKTNDVAITSDRGMPLVSDSGFHIVREYSKKGHVKVIPGVSAVTTAFALSAFSHRFCFIGFLTSKDWKNISLFPYSLIIFEAPHRLLNTLQKLYEVLGHRNLMIAKEMTKFYEQVVYCTLGNIPEFEIKGEFTIVIGPE